VVPCKGIDAKSGYIAHFGRSQFQIKPSYFVVRSTQCLGELDMLRIVLGLMLLTFPAVARDNGQWGNQPGYLRQWFQRLMQPDNPVMSCCGEADAFEADSFENSGDHYVAIITNGKGLIPEGTRIPVPNNKIKWEEGNPTGHGIIFIGNGGQVYCYVTPGGV
jgi:hypothetical protein